MLMMASPDSNKRHKGMTRHAKIFYQIDKEGLLMETVSISASVNFDCYESIVTSAQRVLASHQKLKPNNISVESLFYYKKRARSNRMNPAQIYTTTDVFRAVAEHPSGEIPLGVLWTTVTNPKTNYGPIVERSRNLQAKVDKEAFDMIRKNIKEEVIEEAGSGDAPVAKKARIDVSQPQYTFKTYMPQVTEPTSNPRIVSVTSNYKEHDVASTVSQASTVTNDAVNATPSVSSESNGGLPAADKVRPLQAKAAYQWPPSVTCEVILHYDGISERKVLSPGLSNVVEHLVRGNFSQLSNETVNTLRMGTRDLLDVFKEVNSIDSPVDPLHAVTGLKDPIKYLHTAKTEIFKLLSLVSLSRHKFKQLLDWMKTLKLEEGKQGKFYLSERTQIGAGLKATYDTNSEAAEKLNNLYKSRTQRVKPQVVHPLTALNQQKPATVASVEPGHPMTVTMPDGATGSQLMFLVPKDSSGQTLIPVSGGSITQAFIPASGPPVGSTVMPPISALSRLPSTAIGGTKTHATITTTSALRKKLEEGTESVSTTAAKGKSSRSQATDTAELSNESTPSPGETSKGNSNLPTILRRKQKQPTQKKKNKSADSPVPMHLYRSYGTRSGRRIEQESENFATFGDSAAVESVTVESVSNRNVKQEAEDYHSDTTEDATEDGDSANLASPSEEGTFSDSDKTSYGTVLKSDARMPQASDTGQHEGDKPFEIIIKSEPMDTYE